MTDKPTLPIQSPEAKTILQLESLQLGPSYCSSPKTDKTIIVPIDPSSIAPSIPTSVSVVQLDSGSDNLLHVAETQSNLSAPPVSPTAASPASPIFGGARHSGPVSPVASGPFLPNNDSVLHLRGTQKKLVIVMVGLPARGKTYIARKLSRYLNWLGYRCQVFNIGNYRRAYVGSQKESDFFDPSNPEGVAARNAIAIAALDDMMKFLREGGEAAVFDGTNTTEERRKSVLDHINRSSTPSMPVELVWVESICTDPTIIEKNIREFKVTSPDYVGVETEVAVKDFRERIHHYEKAYEPLQDETLSYVKIINTGRQVLVNRIFGYLPTRIVFFLMNLRINKNPIFLSRHGESEYNTVERIGGDTPLTARGAQYARVLAEWTMKQPEVVALYSESPPRRLPVWCSCLKRTIQTASEIPNCELVHWRALNEIESGKCDGMTYEEIHKQMPEEYAARKTNKLRYRYPQGESYVDLIQRLEPVIFELERVQGPLIVVAHQAVLRCLYAYFHDLPPEQIPYLEVPIHTVIKLIPKAYGCETHRYVFPL